jgi:hypothetical protein
MATQVSPGVDITVIDESPYSSAGQGTVPLIVFGTHEYKAHPSGQGVAEGTLPENANKVYLITSQRELIQTFGNPIFHTSGGNPLHGYELNEYGLHAAYQYLGLANRCYVIRSSLDYTQLLPRSVLPRGEPINGTYWFDIKSTVWGVFESNGGAIPGTAWNDRTPLVINVESQIEKIILGEVGAADPTSGGVASVAGTININNQTVTLSAGMTLQQIANAITSAVNGVTALTFRLSGKSYIMLRQENSSTELKIDSTGTTVQLLTDLGLTTPGNVIEVPKSTIGIDGSFAIITSSNDNQLYQKIKPQGVTNSADPFSISFWFPVGSNEWKKATPTRIEGSLTPQSASSPQVFEISTDNTSWVTINVASGDTVHQIASTINSVVGSLPITHTCKNVVASVESTRLVIGNGNGDDLYLKSTDTILNALGMLAMPAYKKGNRVHYASHVNIPTGSASGDVWIKTTPYNKGVNWVIKLYSSAKTNWDPVSLPLYADDVAATNGFGGTMSIGTLYVRYNLTGTTNNPSANHQIRRWNGTIWEPLVYEANVTAPTTEATEGTMWYNSNMRVDIMINKDGQRWLGYKNYPGLSGVDPNGPILAGSPPIYQTTGSPLVNGDLWIDTSNLENFPTIYRWDIVLQRWVLVDNTDQTTPFGIVFADARHNYDGTKNGAEDPASMLVSDYLDPDAPDPRQYPDGVLLFNTRYSTYNVKEWRPNYFKGEFQDTNYTLDGVTYTVGNFTHDKITYSGRWITISGNELDGSPKMGRKAQRSIVVRELQKTMAGNDDIRSETLYFNLISCPGYVELVVEMIKLNEDKKGVAFVVGDTPARLKPDGTSVTNWANPQYLGVQSNSEKGLVSFNEYVAVWYPWGLSTNIDGREVMIPASSIALHTIAFSDSISDVWMAPAGYTRGRVTNATTVGYLTAEGEFKAVMLNQGQRDVLYTNKINPIAYMVNRGLVVFGQKTRHSIESAMDRINVSRLVCYLKKQLDDISRPFLFENNNQQTRDSVKTVFDRFMSELQSRNAIYDYIVVCDNTNNTPERIDRNELWVDIAIQPQKSIEFIYIPLRLVSTSEDLEIVYNKSGVLR